MPESNHRYTLLVLDNLQDLAGSPNVLAHMLSTIESTLGEDLGQLKQHTAAQRIQALGEKLHAFKGYIPMMCQPAMGDRLVAVEALARDQNTRALWGSDQLSRLLQDLDTLHQEIQAAAAGQG